MYVVGKDMHNFIGITIFVDYITKLMPVNHSQIE